MLVNVSFRGELVNRNIFPSYITLIQGHIWGQFNCNIATAGSNIHWSQPPASSLHHHKPDYPHQDIVSGGRQCDQTCLYTVDHMHHLLVHHSLYIYLSLCNSRDTVLHSDYPFAGSMVYHHTLLLS